MFILRSVSIKFAGNLDLVTSTWIQGKIEERKPVAFGTYLGISPVPSSAGIPWVVEAVFNVAFLRLWNLERHGNEANPILALFLADSYRLMAENLSK